MKKIFAGLFLAGSFALASAQTISFDKTVFDYGTVKVGADGHRVFTVKNTGDKPLIISKVQASCGCTTPEWSQDPIMPGKTAQIKVGYNTTLVGPFTKIIEVYSNDAETSRSTITIKGNVMENPQTAMVAQPAARVETAVVKSAVAEKVAPATAKQAKKLNAKN
ncbi:MULTISPECIES: DUF1573 domain-containing protein [unclassified Kaistella]|uniref:DUF1573 domain-containing protein n=1 Tax=unclassified Kaistella TaxID=2762626 RepID=UPI00273257F0|nr:MULTISPECIES: DUF1573 domain-containing protein [unclassified Kaistella]MDP2454416.1 DUF1573 domain-containing protein [Kaistella sp. SH11-4b]MDP2457903.1 DUF1573 domain-containing protein [Kaistella sp. SH40-3]MDP2460809.1 DUF1573 domain-containing protein [Kaistella sp. SH19-2b]